MNDFQKRFEERRTAFDRDFENAKKWGFVRGIISIAINLGLIGFGIWVVISLMRIVGIVI